MISGILHSGSGLGNQLFRYVATRVLAEDKGYDFSMVAPENFKGKTFMNLDMGIQHAPVPYVTEQGTGKVIPKSSFEMWQEKTNYYNPEINFVGRNVIIDGEFQDERYFEHRLKEIDEWLEVEPIAIPNDTCVIGFRGGEFKIFPELFLPIEYWNKSIENMLEINPDMKFEVHTDDAPLAGQIFPGFKVIHDIGINWRSMRCAKYAIIANSSFYILPRLLRKGITIAPRYWARHNTNEWSMPQNYYKSFTYIHG